MGRRSNSRTTQRRRSKTTVLIVTNGEMTEREYLNGLVRLARDNAELDFTVQVRCIPGEPSHVLRKLRSPHGDVSEYDEVWLVFDVDDKSHSSFLTALRTANRSRQNQGRFRAVFSNPCFEVWLAAHYADVKNYQDRDDAKRHFGRLTERSPNEKSLPPHFPWENIAAACQRVVTHPCSEGAVGELGAIPSTSMPALVRRLGIATAPPTD